MKRKPIYYMYISNTNLREAAHGDQAAARQPRKLPLHSRSIESNNKLEYKAEWN